jgi:hypothetical protein
MRTLLVLLGFAVVALVFANPDRASARSLESVIAVEASQTTVIAASAAVDQAEHCAHVPCANSAHSHSSGPCAAHSFVLIGDGWVTPGFVSAGSIGRKNDRYAGRTLLPPVPPPLA